MVLKKIIFAFLFISFGILTFFCNEKNKNDNGTITDENVKKSDTINKENLLLQTKFNPKYKDYYNSRYGFFVKYPENLIIQHESENNDGIELIGDDGFNLKVYGSNDANVFNMSLNDFYKKELTEHKDVTYKVKKKNWFVISGYDGEFIFYIKKYVGNGSTNTLFLKYPSNLRDKYYDVITVISKSFKEGNIDNVY